PAFQSAPLRGKIVSYNKVITTLCTINQREFCSEYFVLIAGIVIDAFLRYTLRPFSRKFET
ncbi:MAG: hypothetical protein LBQ66_08620, partial [Planctomycetaceae bacterium]|nr:hypothetical protein [Planctomycetaceae bacterium]